MTVILFEGQGIPYNKNKYAVIAGCCFFSSTSFPIPSPSAYAVSTSPSDRSFRHHSGLALQASDFNTQNPGRVILLKAPSAVTAPADTAFDSLPIKRPVSWNRQPTQLTNTYPTLTGLLFSSMATILKLPVIARS
jgi:hypothetical protein